MIIENIYLKNGKVSVMVSQLLGNTLDADLPDIHLKDIGKKEGGATPGEVASQTIDAVLAQVTSLVGKIDLSSITGALGENAAGAVKAISEGAGDATKALSESVGDTSGAVEDAAKSAEGAVKSLFGGGN